MIVIRNGVPHMKISMDVPLKQVRALIELQRQTGETRSKLVRRLIADELRRASMAWPQIRDVLDRDDDATPLPDGRKDR